MTPSQPQTSITFPTVEAALSALAKPVLGADCVVIEPLAPPPVPDGLPPIPDGYVYIGEDNGSIVTGDLTVTQQYHTIRWARGYSARWIRTSYVSGRSNGWHAIAPVGSVLAQLNGHPAPAATPETQNDALRERDDAVAEVMRLREELETERNRLAACGVVALADTPESAAKARQMLPKYHSASCRDVERRVDECIKLRTVEILLRNQISELVSQRDRYRRSSQNLEAETQRLHAQWHAAAVDANEQREEVKRLAKMLDNARWDKRALAERLDICQSGNRSLAKERDQLKPWKGHAETFRATLAEVTAALTKVTAERNALHARVAELEARQAPTPEPQYRLLEVGEKIQPGDECYARGQWVATPDRVHGVTIRELGSTEVMGNYGFYRRPLSPG